MNLLFVASEVAPFCKTGGLGDVAGALPQALAASGVQVSVVMPLYETISEEWRNKMDFVRQLNVQLSWRNQPCGIFSLEKDGITYYFLENAYYFNRRELYGHYDDGERFAFFSKAVLDMLPAIGCFPDVIHANDWQTALIPIYLRLMYAYDPRYARIKTVFTIHNIQYQGNFPRGFLTDVTGIDDVHYRSGLLAFDDGINLVKGAVCCADSLTTVSPSYAGEILTPYYAHGLDAILRDNRQKLSGVVNGIDVDAYNPATDPRIAENYSPADPSGKAVCKQSLQHMLGLREEPDTPIIAIITRLAEHKGLDLIGAVLDDIMTENVQLVVLGRGEWRYEQLFDQARRRYPGRVSVNILFSEDLAHQIYAGADILLMPSKSEPCGLAQMIAMRYGTLPLVRETGGLKDTVHAYNPADGSGNGFSFANFNAHDMLYTVRHAVQCYQDEELWNTLALRGMSADLSWKRSAADYIAVYEKTLV